MNTIYKYNSKHQDFKWMIYYEQIKLIDELKKITPIKNILEIGCEKKVVTNFLKESGFDVTTLDIVSEFNPDVVSSVEDLSMFSDKQFDLILCSTVLEYVPLKRLKETLKGICRVSKYTIIFNVAHNLNFIFMFKIPLIQKKYINFNFPLFKKHNPSYEWELNNEISISEFKENFGIGTEILKEHYVKYYPRAYYFLLKNQDAAFKKEN